MTPGMGPVLTQGYHMNRIDIGPNSSRSNDQSYTPSCFREQEFENFSSLFLCFKLVTPGVGPNLTPGASYVKPW